MTHPNSFSLSCSQNADSHSSTAMERKWRIPFWKKLWLENMLTFGDSQNRASMLPNSSPKTISRTHLHKASWAFQCLSQIENKWQALYVKSLYHEREKPKNIEKKKNSKQTEIMQKEENIQEIIMNILGWEEELIFTKQNL